MSAVDQPPAVALTALTDAWLRAIETEIGAALCAIWHRKDFDFDFDIPLIPSDKSVYDYRATLEEEWEKDGIEGLSLSAL